MSYFRRQQRGAGRELARRYGINQKAVRKWRAQSPVMDEQMGPEERRSSILSAVEEAAIVALWVQARLPLYDAFLP